MFTWSEIPHTKNTSSCIWSRGQGFKVAKVSYFPSWMGPPMLKVNYLLTTDTRAFYRTEARKQTSEKVSQFFSLKRLWFLVYVTCYYLANTFDLNLPKGIITSLKGLICKPLCLIYTVLKITNLWIFSHLTHLSNRVHTVYLFFFLFNHIQYISSTRIEAFCYY